MDFCKNDTSTEVFNEEMVHFAAQMQILSSTRITFGSWFDFYIYHFLLQAEESK